MNFKIEFEKYLHRSGHTEKTVKSYMHAYKIITNDNSELSTYKFKDIVNYLNQKSNDFKNANTKVYILNGLKKYFDFLIDVGLRDDHPCKSFQVRNQRRKEVIHQDLFSSQELELLLEREERYGDLVQKNKVIISLLIYQGLTGNEICNLKLQHIDLDNGKIFVRASKKIGQRHLELHPKQYRLIDNYINDGRKKLMREPSDFLILGKLGTHITTEGVNYVISTLQGLFPDRHLTSTSIRKSVIANWLNEKKLPLEQVQIMSGQKWMSTTVKYRQNNLEEQRELMNKWFPI